MNKLIHATGAAFPFLLLQLLSRWFVFTNFNFELYSPSFDCGRYVACTLPVSRRYALVLPINFDHSALGSGTISIMTRPVQEIYNCHCEAITRLYFRERAVIVTTIGV